MALARSNLETALSCGNSKDSDESGSVIKNGVSTAEYQKENINSEVSKMSEQSKEDLPPKNEENASKDDNVAPFQSPQNKRRKLGESFDDLVKKLDYNILYLNFMKLHNFIESDDMKSLCLPFFYNLKTFEDFFKMVIDNMELLESKSLDDGKYRNICDKITQAMIARKSEFKLIHSYMYIEQIKNIILTIEKQYFGVPVPPALSTSNSSTELSATSSTESLRSTSSDQVSVDFKTQSLRKTLDFIQNEAIRTKIFPELSVEQICYVQSLLQSEELKDTQQEVSVLYRHLCDALKVLKNRYDLKMQTIESGNVKKHLLMEKIEKLRPSDTTVISQRSDINISTSTNMNPQPPKKPINPQKENATKPIQKQSAIRVMPAFAKQALTNVLEFIASDETTTVFSPNDCVEFWFYTRCIKWVKEDKRVQWTDETRQLFGQLKTMLLTHNVVARRKKIDRKNETTLKYHQITYTKSPLSFTPEKKRKRKSKVELKNLININGVTENIPADVMDKSLRKKKKDKKRLQKMIDRQKQTEKAIERRKLNQKMDWRDIELERKGKLREGLSMPVQSDKAMRMMRGMGWSGGALGARGNGIMEPITLEIDQPKGVGFGHWKRDKVKPQVVQNKKPFPKSIQDWINDIDQTDTPPLDTDIIVEKTKKLLQENISFDIIMNEGFKVPKVPENVPVSSKKNEQPSSTIQKNCPQASKNEPHSSKTFKNEPQSPQNIKRSNNESSAPQKNELQNSTTQQNELQSSKNELQNSRSKILIVYNSQLDTMRDDSTASLPITSRTVLRSPRDIRNDFLQAMLDIFTKNLQVKTLKYFKGISGKEKRFFKQALEQLNLDNAKHFPPLEKNIVKKILNEYRERPNIVVKAIISDSTKELSLRPIPVKLLPVKRLTNEENINTYVHTSLPIFATQSQFYGLKLAISILLSLKDFLNSKSDELDIDFTKVLNRKQISYVEHTVENINARVKNGSSPAEANISTEILKSLQDDQLFISVMFDHSYRSLTFTKHFHNLAPNSSKPKEISHTVIYMDSTSDSSSSPYKKPSRPIITEADITDDDASSLSEDVHLPKLPPLPAGKEGVNLKEYAKLYNRMDEKENTSIAEKIIRIMENKETDSDNELGDRKTLVRTDYAKDNCDTSVEYIVCVNHQETCDDGIPQKNMDDDANNEKDANDLPIYEKLPIFEGTESNPMKRSNELDSSLTKQKNTSLRLVENESKLDVTEPNNAISKDCDFSKINLDLSEDICDNNLESVKKTDRIKSGVKIVYIVHANDPIDKINKDKAREIQKVMSDNIVGGKKLPLLKCHGYQYDSLIYSCQNQDSYVWLESVIQSIGDLKILIKNHTKMVLSLRCLYDFDTHFLFNMLELYNEGLSTKYWEVVCKKEHEDLLVRMFVVEMDEASINYIFSSNMALYAGVDKVEFTLACGSQ
ncbi:unnamed protein product [Spodoptera exigua]|nr:unnamed protein product [Spodoptera exigua]